MTRQKIEQLLLLLDEYYKEITKTCEYECYSCDLGVLEGCGSRHSCAIETVVRNIVDVL